MAPKRHPKGAPDGKGGQFAPSGAMPKDAISSAPLRLGPTDGFTGQHVGGLSPEEQEQLRQSTADSIIEYEVMNPGGVPKGLLATAHAIKEGNLTPQTDNDATIQVSTERATSTDDLLVRLEAGVSVVAAEKAHESAKSAYLKASVRAQSKLNYLPENHEALKEEQEELEELRIHMIDTSTDLMKAKARQHFAEKGYATTEEGVDAMINDLRASVMPIMNMYPQEDQREARNLLLTDHIDKHTGRWGLDSHLHLATDERFRAQYMKVLQEIKNVQDDKFMENLTRNNPIVKYVIERGS